ncbi:trafficking protein particle complex subunit 11-like isoform X3 [Varroa jacobsoni]|nr:trafficking protein particle complex subunit 11-like isoform X4 [Varroa destructor]XP_022665893.1 trafficking protein particle complex subunit 11-like isoform X4 [Varroa destructor]XP_022665894.1 trafficking protein particle complex subunit 11-like isoform X4 [Varroa destructor]XP_022665896.1 trafficking protein particle complex subunit 11-like isoform X4 [Varroa destructor]XP_022665897.1 trafficking protein particle complex subunit 11-like isoform X4 [Varroa destructor]XP_022699439.1 traff
MEIGAVPNELVARLRANIAFCGLDLEKPEHLTIWQAFTEARAPEREPLQFTNVSLDHVFPQAKTKRTSFEGYVERGILKANWLIKHTRLIPAVGVFFFDLDWDEPDFAERKDLAAQNLLNFKRNLSGRDSRLCLVLVQRRASSPVSDNKLAAERAHELTQACEIPLKALFVLQYTEHLLGFIMRLETAIMEQAKGYYSAEYRRMAGQNQLVTKGTYQLLCIRHHFKMATFQELKQDASVAIKHYKQAYILLAELRATDPNLLEVKTIAGIINYKICQLYYEQNAPLEAIHQLRRHMENFKTTVGPPGLAFEHYAWLTKQSQLFGDLFESAIRRGLTPIQTQHPGFYYSSAAQYAVQRKKAARQLCQAVTTYPSPDPLSGADQVPYYGQRPWRAAAAKGEAPDPALEELAIRALQYKERQTNHSSIIIPLLSGAVSQFKKYKGPRIKRHQMVLLAEEYASNSEPDKALSILMHVLIDFRQERWPPLLTRILGTALRVAYLAANPIHFLTLALEYMATWTDCTAEQRDGLLKSVARLLDGQPPGRPFTDLEDTSGLWTEKLQAFKTNGPVQLDMDKVRSCIYCKAYFSSPSYSSNETIELHIYVRSQLPFDVNFITRFNVHFNHNVYDGQCSISDNRVLGLVAGRTHRFSFTFPAGQQHVGTQIKVVGVSMLLGQPEWEGQSYKPLVQLNWTAASLGTHFFRLAWDPIPSRAIKQHREQDFKELPYRLVASIVHREARMAVSWSLETPALVGELLPVRIQLTNNEAGDIGNVKLTLFTAVPNSKSTIVALDPSLAADAGPSVTMDIPPVRSGASQNIEVFIKAAEPGTRELELTAFYETSLVLSEGKNVLCRCHKQDRHKLEAAVAFSLEGHLLNKKLAPVSKLHEGEPFVLAVDVSCIADGGTTLLLGEGQLQPAAHVSIANSGDAMPSIPRSQMEGVQLRAGESARSCYTLEVTPPASGDPPAPLGHYRFYWRRSSYAHWNSAQLTLPAPVILSCPLSLSLEAPAHARVSTPLYISYHLRNRSERVQELSLQVNSSEGFMFAGSKQLSLRIAPGAVKRLQYTLYPLVAGYVALPKLQLLLDPSVAPVEMDSAARDMLPSFIFVMPHSRGTRSPS